MGLIRCGFPSPNEFTSDRRGASHKTILSCDTGRAGYFRNEAENTNKHQVQSGGKAITRLVTCNDKTASELEL